MSQPLFVWANNASSLIASAITSTDTTVTVTSGQGALFPTISAGEVAACAIEDVSGNIEVVYATGRTGDTLTIERAQESTTALAFASGSRIEQRVTAAQLATFLQADGGGTLSGTTDLTGVLALGSGGSIQGGEIAGSALRSAPGVTSNQILIPTGGGPATQAGSVILTAANINANLGAGIALIVTGMVVGWTGLSTAVPSGWHLCDGTNGTVDLRDRFIVGGGGSLATTGTYASTTGASSAGTPTIVSPTIAIGNLPSHAHANVIYAGNSGSVIGPAGTPAGSDYFTSGSGAGVAINWSTGAVGSGTALPITANAMGTHTHAVNAPPYTAMFMIQKL